MANSITNVTILSQQGSVLGIHKPAGLAVQAPEGCDSLETRLFEQLAKTQEEFSGYLAFPHRLDRCVTGIMIGCTTKRATRLLSDQFAARRVQKAYLAVICGQYVGDDVWEDFVRKIPDQAKAEIVDESVPGAKLAKTKVEIIGQSQSGTLLRLWPETGRMHQLRIQAASRGFPILGDTLYGSPKSSVSESVDRILLHAETISFRHPKNGIAVTMTSPADETVFGV